MINEATHKRSANGDPVYSISFENPTPEALIQAGFPSLVDIHKHFSKGDSLKNYEEGTSYKDIPRIREACIFGLNFEDFIKQNEEQYKAIKKEINDDTFFRQFMAKVFLEKQLNAYQDDGNYLKYNKLYCHQGAFFDNTHDFLSPDKPLTVLNPRVSYLGIHINNGVQFTSVVSNITKILKKTIHFDDGETYDTEIIASNDGKTLMEVTSIFETNLKENSAKTIYFKVKIFEELVKELYFQQIKLGSDRKMIEDIIKEHININKNLSMSLNITVANTIFSIYDEKNKNYQVRYLNFLIKSLDAYKNEDEENITVINSILNAWHQAIFSKKISTITSNQLYAAQLKHGMGTTLTVSENKKYDALYNKKENRSIQDSVVAVLNSYGTGKFKSFFFRKPKINEVAELMNTLSISYNHKGKTSIEKTLDENHYVKNIVINTIEFLKDSKSFDSRGELAKMANFLIGKLDDEIIRLTSELEKNKSDDFTL